jgi:hypothetical protein
MGDWLRTERTTQDRTKGITGGSLLTSGGIFQGLIESSSGENQNARLVYAGGSSAIALPMPFETTDSWIRSIPMSGSSALVTYRRDTGEATFIRYLNDIPDKKITGYKAGNNLYKPLLAGEHEIHSSGLAQSYYSQRPLLEQRGGVIRSWLDQDRAECGQKAPIHTRQLHTNRTNAVGDEERFGVVRRPKKLNPVNAALLGDSHSSNFYQYPYPNFALPGGVPNAFAAISETVGTASEMAASLTGTYKIRPFAKEYLRVIKNPMFPLPPIDTLLDIREGQVFDDDGVQVIGDQGTYLRSKREYYTTWGDATKCEIDELGGVSWYLSTALASGMANWSMNVPGGSFKLDTSFGIEMNTYTSLVTSSLMNTSISATTDISLDSTLNTSFATGLNFSHSTNGTHDVESMMDMTLKSSMNFNTEASLVYEAKAGVQMNLNAPIVQIGSSPAEPTVMGTQMVTWMKDLVDAFINNAANIGIGNMGAPVPLNPSVLSLLMTLQSLVISDTISPLTSKTITVTA